MAQFKLLIRDNLEGYSRYTGEEMAQLIEKMAAWKETLKGAGVHRGAEKLTDDLGKTLRKRNGQIVLDGPYAEARELIGGYFLVETRDEAEAIELARECPVLNAESEIDIREVANTCEEVVRLRAKRSGAEGACEMG